MKRNYVQMYSEIANQWIYFLQHMSRNRSFLEKHKSSVILVSYNDTLFPMKEIYTDGRKSLH